LHVLLFLIKLDINVNKKENKVKNN